MISFEKEENTKMDGRKIAVKQIMTGHINKN